MSQKIFKTSFTEHLVAHLKAGDFSAYYSDEFKPDVKSVLVREDIADPGNVRLKNKNLFGNYEYENAIAIYKGYESLTPEQAADGRLWAYLTHVTFRDYMINKRLPLANEQDKAKIGLILQHWFVYPLNAKNILRNDIALMWWGAYLTYDKNKTNPFELTKELFSMADYTRTLLPSVQGRNNIFTRSLLEYVISNKDLFSKYKEGKVRKLMEKLNFRGGHSVLTVLDKDELFKIFDLYRSDIELVTGR